MNRTRFNGGFFVAASPTRCRHFAATTKEKGATFSRNPLFYLVELAGVEPASEIPTYHFYYNKKSKFLLKTYC
ncbi:hypothetical protein DRD60_15370 [Salmonella enterica subsp. enterica serovar Enteritidis]|nr:hypothetical protein [Salmonella enterica subsp. enterica serovar Enteritidis]ECD5520445.1 hypothetical protein [Salmonella enterica subsp. enterica serovar Enteritidis]